MDRENSLTLLWPDWGSNPIISDPQSDSDRLRHRPWQKRKRRRSRTRTRTRTRRTRNTSFPVLRFCAGTKNEEERKGQIFCLFKFFNFLETSSCILEKTTKKY
jgi:hypothetical protein